LTLRISQEARTGMTSSDMNREPAMANTLVKATGRNSFPSSPCSDKSGTKTMAMMRAPDTTGAVTSRMAR
jgi:hypothetical protein